MVHAPHWIIPCYLALVFPNPPLPHSPVSLCGENKSVLIYLALMFPKPALPHFPFFFVWPGKVCLFCSHWRCLFHVWPRGAPPHGWHHWVQPDWSRGAGQVAVLLLTSQGSGMLRFWQGHCGIYPRVVSRVGQNHKYTVHIRYFWQGNHQIYGHVRCIYTVMANPSGKTWGVRETFCSPFSHASRSKSAAFAPCGVWIICLQSDKAIAIQAKAAEAWNRYPLFLSCI